MKNSISLLLLLFSPLLYATTYTPQTVEQQLQDADAVIWGNYKDSAYRISKNGEVVTDLIFDISRSFGVKFTDAATNKNFKVTIPGGIWQGIKHHVPGVPHFQKEEEIILILSKNENGYELTNYGYSKFNIIKEDGQNYLISRMGAMAGINKISTLKFDDLAYKYIERKQSISYKIQEVSDESLNPNSESIERSPASIGKKNDSSEDKMNLFWPFVLFAVLGIFATISGKFRNEEHAKSRR